MQLSLALARSSDPGTSHEAATAQHPATTEDDILLALQTFSFSQDPTPYEIWKSFMQWRDEGTVVSAFSRLKKAGKVEVTGKRVPSGKRLPQATYRCT